MGKPAHSHCCFCPGVCKEVAGQREAGGSERWSQNVHRLRPVPLRGDHGSRGFERISLEPLRERRAPCSTQPLLLGSQAPRPLVGITGTVSLSRSVWWAQLSGGPELRPAFQPCLEKEGDTRSGQCPAPPPGCPRSVGPGHAGLCFVSPSVCVQSLDIAELARG